MKNLALVFVAGVVLFFFSGCSSVLFMTDDNSWLPLEIDSMSDFFGVCFVLFVSFNVLTKIFGLALRPETGLLGLVLGPNFGFTVALLLHIYWIVWFRDYGFFRVFLIIGSVLALNFIILRLYWAQKIKKQQKEFWADHAKIEEEENNM